MPVFFNKLVTAGGLAGQSYVILAIYANLWAK